LTFFILCAPLSFLTFALLVGRTSLGLMLSPYVLILNIFKILRSAFPLRIEDETLVVLSLTEDACPCS
jgi:hypothetical protein